MSSFFHTLLSFLPQRNSSNPPQPFQNSYNEPLEVAHSRIERLLNIEHCHSSHLLASIQNKLDKPWIEDPPQWRQRQAVKEAQRRRREARDGKLVGKLVVDEFRREGKTVEKLREEENHRKETMRKIWGYEIEILNGKGVEAAQHPGIEAEARSRYGEEVNKFLIRGESEEFVEDLLRERMDKEVDEGREFGIKWEVLRLMLERFLAYLEAAKRVMEMQRNTQPENGPYDQKVRDHARWYIFQKLFLEDYLITAEDWETQLRAQIAHFESLGRRGEWGLENIRAVVTELEYYKLRGGFTESFVRKYGAHAMRGYGSWSEWDKLELRRQMVNLRNENTRR